ncbi:MAG: hypothetical protein NC218_03355 [Acetobacter sp.]|nr:hypothetical protein [Acetobacter sp.]
MRIIYNEYEKRAIAEASNEYKISAQVIEDNLTAMLDANFDQDLHDLLNENAEELRKEDK